MIKDFLDPSHVMIDVRTSDKTRLLRELAGRAAVALDLSADQVSTALSKREELGSTGTGGGVAIPHARLDGVNKPFGMLVRLAKAIDFDAIDGQQVDIVFCCCCRRNPQGEQLNALARAARALRNPDTLRNLRHAGDETELYRAVAKSASNSKPA